jgi:hypothetical protein
MPRFAILYHETPTGSDRAPHFDFMLQSGNVLRTWALSDQPSRGQAVEARMLPDHRLHYLDYEGPVSENRGTVTRWDGGTFQWLTDLPGEVVVRVTGTRLAGTVSLTLPAESCEKWSFLFST